MKCFSLCVLLYIHPLCLHFNVYFFLSLFSITVASLSAPLYYEATRVECKLPPVARRELDEAPFPLRILHTARLVSEDTRGIAIVRRLSDAPNNDRACPRRPFLFISLLLWSFFFIIAGCAGGKAINSRLFFSRWAFRLRRRACVQTMRTPAGGRN